VEPGRDGLAGVGAGEGWVRVWVVGGTQHGPKPHCWGVSNIDEGQRGSGGGGAMWGAMVSGGRSCSLGGGREWVVGVVGSNSTVWVACGLQKERSQV